MRQSLLKTLLFLTSSKAEMHRINNVLSESKFRKTYFVTHTIQKCILIEISDIFSLKQKNGFRRHVSGIRGTGKIPDYHVRFGVFSSIVCCSQ